MMLLLSLLGMALFFGWFCQQRASIVLCLVKNNIPLRR